MLDRSSLLEPGLRDGGDVVCHFNTQAIGFQRGDTQAILRGATVDGVPIEGHDMVRIVPKKK